MKSLPLEGKCNSMHALRRQRKKQRRIGLKAIEYHDHIPVLRLIVLFCCKIPNTSVEAARLRYEVPAAVGERSKSCP